MMLTLPNSMLSLLSGNLVLTVNQLRNPNIANTQALTLNVKVFRMGLIQDHWLSTGNVVFIGPNNMFTYPNLPWQ